ncbi:hypothetical protein PTTG_25555 [Puccinia triticina 1-1 BBBD Race 1]|uniref:Uncharacterized protein n=1 Tax=Puccinia triticina (isolate 1-1 / race 1 (BBBD)) TaxID=630390 RepID=A0A180H2Q4_PUCT1|nr:hypothetical protein PTTG_25555 [Puccinia triticina 1-1 BBBD Race 1]
MRCLPEFPPSSLPQGHVFASTRKKGSEPTSFGVPSDFQPDPCCPIRKSPTPEFSQSESPSPDPVSAPRGNPLPRAIDHVLEKISEMMRPGLSASKSPKKKPSISLSVSAALLTAEKMNTWILLRNIKIDPQEVKVSSGTLVEGSGPMVFSALRPPVARLLSYPINLQEEVKLSLPSPICLQDEVKLASRSFSNSTNQQPSFQSQIRLHNENKLADPDPSSDSDPAECLCSPQVHLRNEGKLVPRCLGFLRRHRSIKLSPPKECVAQSRDSLQMVGGCGGHTGRGPQEHQNHQVKKINNLTSKTLQPQDSQDPSR